MNLTTKLALGTALVLGSATALAQVAVPTPPYNSALNLPTLGNGSATLTLFSTNDNTPYSYNFNLGLNASDLLPTNGMNTPGTTLTWNLTGLTIPSGVAATDLVWDVTAGQINGSVGVAGTNILLTTVDPAVGVPAFQSGGVSTALSANDTFLNNLNAQFPLTNPRVTTNPTDTTYANAVYNAQLSTFTFNAAVGTSSTANFFEFINGKGKTSATSVTQYAGVWALNLANDTLTYTVAGGSPTPLPAGVWLLLSGLVGMGVVGRRKGGALPVAA